MPSGPVEAHAQKGESIEQKGIHGKAMTAANDIERDLRARYRQPAGVEQFGIEPIPEERKTVGWFDLFSIMFNFLINPGTMLSGGMMVAAGLSFQAAITAGFLGTVVALVFYVIMATIGVDYGIPGQVATRAVYGLRGAKAIPSLLRALVSIYWFAFQTFAGASAIVAVLAKITGTTYPLVWVSLAFALVQASVAVIGFGSLKALARVDCRSRWSCCATSSFCSRATMIRISSSPRYCRTRALAGGAGHSSPVG
jgi:hypothetical protein